VLKVKGGKKTMLLEAMEPGSNWDYETDVVIVGYGGAGAAAAIEAYDKGAAVLIIEKASVAGGTTAISAGVIVGAGTSIQRERGITDSPEEMYKYFKATGRGLDDSDMVKILCDNSASNIEWLIGMGMEFKYLYVSGAEDYPEYSSITPVKPRGHSTGSGGAFFKVLKNACDKRKIVCLYETKLKEIISSLKGEVVGIQVENKGKPLQIKGKKAVVLACGGYAYNPEMLKQYSFDKGYRAKYTGSVNHTGDGIRAGQMIGADLRCMGQIGAIPAVQRPGQKIARIAHTPGDPSYYRIDDGHYGIVTVNKKGERFTNESGYYNYVAYDMLLPGNLPNYLIFDEKVRTTGPVNWPPWSGNQDNDIKEGTTKKADTIRDLAQKIGVDSNVLKETVNNYNINAEKGVDPKFGKTRDLTPINTPPFYAFERIVGIHSTFGGLKTNTKAQVISVNGTIIRRLYAAGETTGGTIGYNYPTAGTAIQNAICFGRIAGMNAASETIRE
jgi:flavocytochrome c